MKKLRLTTRFLETSGKFRKKNGHLNQIFLRFFTLICMFSAFMASAISQPIIEKTCSAYATSAPELICDGCPGLTCTFILPPAFIGSDEDYVFDFILDDGYVYTFNEITSFDFDTSPDCSDGAVQLIMDGTKLRILMTAGDYCVPPDGGDMIEFDIVVVSEVEADDYEATDELSIKIPLPRKPINLVLVLDISGSMRLLSEGSSAFTRLDALKTAVYAFIDKLEVDDSRRDEDQITLTYFSTTVIQPDPANFPDFVQLTTPGYIPTAEGTFERVEADLDPRTPQQLTALGAGLLDAKDKLATGSPEDMTRLILLFTDGYQNQDPMVNNEGTQAGSDLLREGPPLDSQNDIDYYTIGIGNMGGYAGFIDNIATSNGGQALYTIEGTGAEIQQFFDDQFSGMLSNIGSPQILMKKEGVLTEGKDATSFHINSGVTQAIFQVMHPGQEIQIGVEKAGDILPATHLISRPKYTIFALNFPVNPVSDRQVTPVTSGGEYTLTITGSDDMEYSLTCFVNDHWFDYDCSVDGDYHTVGEALNFTTRLSYTGQPISDDFNVKAIILKPGDDLGHLLSVTETSGSSGQTDDITAAIDKFNGLYSKDPEFIEALELQKQIIDLTNNGDGTFTGTSDNFEISGIYRFVFLINGEIPERGKFERHKVVCTIMNWGEMDEEETRDSTNVRRDAKTALVTFRPVNKFGYYLGPAFHSHIHVKVDSSKAIAGNLRDNLDGSYTIPVTLTAENANPVISIQIMGETLYEGKLNRLVQKPIEIWKLIVLVIIIIILILYYTGALTSVNLPAWLWWILLIIWLIILLLEWLGVLVI
jgi:hypothetical protein